MKEIRISNQQARRFILFHQGLYPPKQMKGKPGILEYIRKVGCIQFDPLDIVGRNPDLVLQARVSDYEPSMLQELLYEERKLLDGWDKNMSIYMIEDWPFFHRIREANRIDNSISSKFGKDFAPIIRKAIEERGPLSSIDIENNQIVDWHWAPARLARSTLEQMYFWGELVIHHRIHTRKVYDFTHHHIPASIFYQPDPNQENEEFHDWYVQRRIGSIGLLWNKAGDAWLGMLGIKSRERQASMTRLIEKGRILEVNVNGIPVPLYIRIDELSLMESMICSRNNFNPHATILAPLDNLLWDRRLIKQLFNFDYVWEVYKPIDERRYGYYVLPVLFGDRFVARFEPGRDKENRALEIKKWWWESEVDLSEEMKSSLYQCFRKFLEYLNMDRLQIKRKIIQQESLDWLIPLT